MNQKLTALYDKGLSFVPADYRVVVSVVLFVVILYVIYHILKKHLVWIVIGAVLVPFIFPAARSIYLTVWQTIQKFFK